jgi:tetratricopeptide (TPR) repeat protein
MSKLGRNDPCYCGSGKKYKHCCLGKEPRVVETPLVIPPLFGSPFEAFGSDEFDEDPYLPEFVEPRRNGSDGTPLERAYALASDAWECAGAERIALARQALEESPDCIDAYNVLAADASPEKAIPLYEQALVTADRVLGPDWRDRKAKRDWTEELDLECANDARLGLGRSFLQLGRVDEAVAEFRGVLAHDPDDYDGVRYDLLDALLEADRDDEAMDLINSYPETLSSRWPYARALLKFRRDGDILWTRRALVDALSFNSGVVPYLLELVTPGDVLPLSNLVGGESDSIDAARNLSAVWKRTPGAIEWLRGIYEAGPKARPDMGPWGDGPTLCVTPSDAVAYVTCPRCEQKTKPRRREVVVVVEPDEWMSAHVACQHCEDCDVLSIMTSDLEKGFKNVMRSRKIDRVRRDHLAVGIVDPSATAKRPPGAADRRWLEDHLLRWRDEISALPELDSLLAGYDLDDEDLDDEDLIDEPEPAGVIDVPYSLR